jgi:hypothetical protein
MDKLTYIAQKQRFKRPANSWCLYYGDAKQPLYGPAYWNYCVTYRNQLLAENSKLKKELIKIK